MVVQLHIEKQLFRHRSKIKGLGRSGPFSAFLEALGFIFKVFLTELFFIKNSRRETSSSVLVRHPNADLVPFPIEIR